MFSNGIDVHSVSYKHVHTRHTLIFVVVSVHGSIESIFMYTLNDVVTTHNIMQNTFTIQMKTRSRVKRSLSLSISLLNRFLFVPCAFYVSLKFSYFYIFSFCVCVFLGNMSFFHVCLFIAPYTRVIVTRFDIYCPFWLVLDSVVLARFVHCPLFSVLNRISFFCVCVCVCAVW